MATRDVDLTKGHDFRTPIQVYDLNRSLKKLNYKLTRYKPDIGVLTGDSLDREAKRYDDGTMCACCGRLLYEKPYVFLIDTLKELCNDCCIRVDGDMIDKRKELFKVVDIPNVSLSNDGHKFEEDDR